MRSSSSLSSTTQISQQQKDQRKSTKTDYNENSAIVFIKRALTPRATWTHKEEFLDAVYWLRQIISIFLGVIMGLLSVKGLLGILAFGLISSLIIFFYSTSIQHVDPEEYGGILEVIKEGFMTAFATFLVSWIVLYSMLNSPGNSTQ